MIGSVKVLNLDLRLVVALKFVKVPASVAAADGEKAPAPEAINSSDQVTETISSDSDYVKPGLVLSPKDRVKKVTVIHEGEEGGLAVAVLDYVEDDGSLHPEVVAIRWNGSVGNPQGFPSVRQYPVWFLIPEELASTIRFLAEEHFRFKLPFDKANAERFMALFGHLFSTESLTKTLKARGYKLTLEM